MYGSDQILFGRSEVRRGLLARLFSDPDPVHPSQLARDLGFTPQAVARELRRLEEAGVVRSRAVGRSLQYEVDRESPVARELEGLVHATVGIEGALRSALEDAQGIEEAFIFGSYASGDLRGHSDIDVLVVGKPDQDDLTRRLGSVEQRTGRDVNVVTYGRAELERKRGTGDLFLRDVFDGPRIGLLPLGGLDAVSNPRRARARRTRRTKAG